MARRSRSRSVRISAPLRTQKPRREGRWLVTRPSPTAGPCSPLGLPSRLTGVEMTDDDPIGELGGLVVPEAPSLALQPQTGASSADLTPEGAQGGLEATSEAPHDREITEAVVAVLLEDALSELNTATGAGNVLLRHFNPETQARKPVEQLTRLLESQCDRDHRVRTSPSLRMSSPNSSLRATPLASPCRANAMRRLRRSALRHHGRRSQQAVSAVVSRLSRPVRRRARRRTTSTFSDAAVLIGCNQAGDVPEPLRRITDSIVTFPSIDRRRFARIFEGVFGTAPAAGWDAAGTDWTHFLVPGDFHMARRLALSADDALSVLRDRVEARLSQVTPDVGPGLSEMYGLGEARQIAEDLIADIQAARAEQIPWSAVDKGLLLIGAPGTGKTTLARAIAKECDVKFVVASAAKWQSAGYLDAHLRAMRGDFAEARRYAPAILFIDELDSIGSRENSHGDINAVYQTDVINALLGGDSGDQLDRLGDRDRSDQLR